MSGGADSAKAVVYALGANFAIAITKYAAAAITGSSSMLAEAFHSTADCGNQLLLLLGIKRAKLPPTPDYPLGFGKETYFWSFVVAIMLFSVGGMFSIYEGVHKLTHPEPLKWAWLAVGVLAFSIVTEGVSMHGCMQEVNKARDGRTIWQWFRETRASELLVIFGEDLAALIGLCLALLAVVLTMVTGNLFFDALGTIAIGVLLIVVAVAVAIEVKALLIGQGVEPKQRAAMVAFLEARPEIDTVYNVLTLQMGTDVMVAIKAKMAAAPTARAMIEAINIVEADFKAEFKDVRWSFFEPDYAD